MNGLEGKLPAVYLKPGEMYFTDRPAVVVTVLGSCLSVTMYHARRGLGGICHGILPSCGGKKTCDASCVEGFRYVDCSIRKMAKLFDKFKVKRSEIEVKCFGGADMFSKNIDIPGLVSIGKQNIEAAKLVLQSERLSLATLDVGGLRGRKILFFPHTGEVLLKRLSKVNNPDLRW